MKRTFEIEWDDDLGPMWMNEGNLLVCLGTPHCIGEDVRLSIRDVTPVAPPDTEEKE